MCVKKLNATKNIACRACMQCRKSLVYDSVVNTRHACMQEASM